MFLDWGLPKDLLLPYSEEKRQMTAGEYCVVHVYLDKHTKRITATARLDRYLDKTPANYTVGQEVDLLVAEATDMGFKAIINNKHWGLIHKNEVFKFLRPGKEEKGFIKEIRADGNISLSLQPVGEQAASSLNSKILAKLRENNGSLPSKSASNAQKTCHTTPGAPYVKPWYWTQPNAPSAPPNCEQPWQPNPVFSQNSCSS